MRIIAILWTVYLVGVCNCGGDTNVTKDVLKGAEKRNPPESTHSETSLASKVDTSLFDLEESLEGSVKVLKLTPKGDKVTQVKYDNKEVWSGSKTLGKSSNLVEALIYFYKEIPALVNIKVVKGGKESTVYKYYDGKQWKDDKEDDYKKKLTALKKKYKHAQPATLDLAKLDESRLDVYAETESGVSFKGYSPKDAFHISSVIDGDKELFKPDKGANEKCILVESYENNTTKVIYLETYDGNNNQSKYYEKTDNEWKDINKEDFDRKIEEMGEAVKSGKNVISLDIAHPNRLLCESFDYHYDDNLTRLIVPFPGRSIEKLTDDTKQIWSLGSGETLQHAKAYLNKGGKPEVMFVVVKDSSGVSRKYYVKEENEWKASTTSFTAYINEIKAEVTNKTNITIDIGSEKETEQCYLISTELLGLQVKMFVPKLGHLAKEVKNGSESLWKAAEGKDERCLSSEIYTKGNSSPLLSITYKTNNELECIYFEKEGNIWKSITPEEFGQKKNTMQTA